MREGGGRPVSSMRSPGTSRAWPPLPHNRSSNRLSPRRGKRPNRQQLSVAGSFRDPWSSSPTSSVSGVSPVTPRGSPVSQTDARLLQNATKNPSTKLMHELDPSTAEASEARTRGTRNGTVAATLAQERHELTARKRELRAAQERLEKERDRAIADVDAYRAAALDELERRETEFERYREEALLSLRETASRIANVHDELQEEVSSRLPAAASTSRHEEARLRRSVAALRSEYETLRARIRACRGALAAGEGTWLNGSPMESSASPPHASSPRAPPPPPRRRVPPSPPPRLSVRPAAKSPGSAVQDARRVDNTRHSDVPAPTREETVVAEESRKRRVTFSPGAVATSSSSSSLRPPSPWDAARKGPRVSVATASSNSMDPVTIRVPREGRVRGFVTPSPLQPEGAHEESDDTEAEGADEQPATVADTEGQGDAEGKRDTEGGGGDNVPPARSSRMGRLFRGVRLALRASARDEKGVRGWQRGSAGQQSWGEEWESAWDAVSEWEAITGNVAVECVLPQPPPPQDPVRDPMEHVPPVTPKLRIPMRLDWVPMGEDGRQQMDETNMPALPSRGRRRNTTPSPAYNPNGNHQ